MASHPNHVKSLREHRIIHSSKRSFECETCQETFATNSSLKNHHCTHNFTVTPLTSNRSNEGLVNDSQPIERRILRSREKPVNYDDNYHKDFLLEDSLEPHRIVHKDKSFNCDESHSKTRDLNEDVINSRTQLGERNVVANEPPKEVYKSSVRRLCAYCGRSYTRGFDLLRHHKSAHKTLPIDKSLTHIETLIPFRCDICNKAFLDKRQLEQHRIAHRMEEGPLKSERNVVAIEPPTAVHKVRRFCAHCGKSYTRWFDLLRHQKSAHKTLPIDQSHKIRPTHIETVVLLRCDICNKEFTDKRDLEQHRIVHRKEEGSFKCEPCRKIFFLKRSMELHARRCVAQLRSRERHCKFDEKVCETQKEQPEHEEIHQEVESHTCVHCGKSYSRAFDLKRHLKTTHKTDQSLENTRPSLLGEFFFEPVIESEVDGSFFKIYK